METRRFVYAQSMYEKMLSDLIRTHSGQNNDHTHLDRANTLDPIYWRHAGIDPLMAATYPLSTKQELVGRLHEGLAYTKKDLTKRMEEQLRQMIANGTKRVISLIDVTPGDIGLTAFEAALELKQKYAEKIDFRIGPQPIFGFKAENHERWKLFCEAAKSSDVLGGLPEKDAEPGRIGFNAHLKKVLELGCKLGKEVHIHVDQANNPSQNETETLIEAVKWIGSPKVAEATGPTVWAIHSISPAGYDERRYKNLLDQQKKYNVGIICCPRAAISMRQLRPILAPTHNCIARLLEAIIWEIPIRLGTDNIGDIFIPTGSNNMIHELIYLADSLRYYVVELLAKIACGVTPNNMDRVHLRQALDEDYAVFKKIQPDFPQN